MRPHRTLKILRIRSLPCSLLPFSSGGPCAWHAIAGDCLFALPSRGTALGEDKRQTEEQAAAFAMKAVERDKFRCGGGKHQRIMGGVGVDRGSGARGQCLCASSTASTPCAVSREMW